MSCDLARAFARALGPGHPDGGATTAADDLLARWGESHRRYHTVAHLRSTLGAVRSLAADGAPGDRDDVELAAWFHDAVHTGRAGDDEEASARLAEHVLAGLGLAPARVAEVARLVRLTAAHDPRPDDAAGCLLCDADLSVLGGSPEAYRDYARAVREEYAHVPDDAFRSGRAAVLRGLTARGQLYRTAEGRARWHDAAARNIWHEVAALESGRTL